MTEQQNLPNFSIEKIYVKDVSLECPHSPQAFLEQETPEIDIQISSSAQPLAGTENYFENTLTVTVTAKLPEDKTLFLVEVAQSAIFLIENVPADELDPILGIACPNILFPYARETVSNLIHRAGFPPVLLQPINFEALYQNHLASQAANEKPTAH